jgi:hypothetical protein
MNAYLLTGDDRYLDVWRRQIDAVNANAKVTEGRTLYPHMYGDQGWYDYTPEKYNSHALELAYLSMAPADLARLGRDGWFAYVSGKQADYAEQSLRADLARVRERVAAMRRDTTTPDTRLADDPMAFNPASVSALVELMLGGIAPMHNASVLNCRLRYFDPVARRAGMPPDVAALVDSLTAEEVSLVLVNVNQLEPRSVIIQAGGYAEHQFVSLVLGPADAPRRSGPEQNTAKRLSIDSPHFSVELAPGAGARLTLQMRRYVNQPTLAFPW